ncbi:MAG: FAD-binding oxidoreductase [Clostridia bacterium]|nr:FAD-binding oxidoreductase [Clostridia bacterium]
MNIYSSEKKTIFPSLAENIPCDVLVIGGGASGLLCAYKLHEVGLKVVVAEKNLIASAKTAYNCGMEFELGAPSYNELYSVYREKTSSVLKDYKESFNRIGKISETVMDGSYKNVKALYFTEEKSPAAISQMQQEYRRRFFLGEKCSFLTWKDALKLYSFNVSCGILTNSAAQSNPVNFCESISHWLSIKGSEIFENTEIVTVNKDPAEKKFTSSAANGSTVTSSAVIDCRGASEICEGDERKKLRRRTVYYLKTEPVKDLTGWYCGSIIIDDCKTPLLLRTDEENRILMTLWSDSFFRRFSSFYDEYMFRYEENLLRSMFFGIEGLTVAECGKFDCTLPKNCFCGAKEDPSLEGFFYICSNNMLGLQDSEIMAEKTSEAVLKFMGK